MIAVIDYNIGNIAAVVNMLRHLGHPCKITSDSKDLAQADRIILPGNGAFDACISNLRASNLIHVLEYKVLHCGVPLLGICVGAQILGKTSSEGAEAGLGWLDMQVVRFPEKFNLRIPQMGWNCVTATKVHPLITNIETKARFYFVHSYYMKPKNYNDVLLKSYYGVDFAAGVLRGNIVGVQFHPEKSHRFGKQFLNSFANWVP